MAGAEKGVAEINDDALMLRRADVRRVVDDMLVDEHEIACGQAHGPLIDEVNPLSRRQIIDFVGRMKMVGPPERLGPMNLLDIEIAVLVAEGDGLVRSELHGCASVSR